MILVDTSVWVGHLRRGDPRLARLLRNEQVVMHPFIRGEIALGHYRQRDTLLELLATLPKTEALPDARVLELIDEHHMMGSGIGYVDAHLLSAAIEHRHGLLTDDKAMAGVAQLAGVAVTF